MNRREFVHSGILGVATLSSLAVGGCGPRDGSSPDARSLAQPELLEALGPETVRSLGQRYRDLVPAERDAGALQSAIFASRPWTARLGLTRESIPEQIRRDFATGRTVIVNGWLLSQTEARQCALYSMLRA